MKEYKSLTSPVLLECLAKLRDVQNAIADYQESNPDYEEHIDNECWDISNGLANVAVAISKIIGQENLIKSYYTEIKVA